ncbi:MAG TPA: hypothetical protein VF790_10430 [Dissulfurispiraceae bacterium]
MAFMMSAFLDMPASGMRNSLARERSSVTVNCSRGFGFVFCADFGAGFKGGFFAGGFIGFDFVFGFAAVFAFDPAFGFGFAALEAGFAAFFPAVFFRAVFFALGFFAAGLPGFAFESFFESALMKSSFPHSLLAAIPAFLAIALNSEIPFALRSRSPTHTPTHAL